MASPIFATAMRRAVRAMRQHQSVPPSSGLPMWRLLLGEVRYLLGTLGRRR